MILTELTDYITKKEMGYEMSPLDLTTLRRWLTDLKMWDARTDEAKTQSYHDGYEQGFKDGIDDKPTEIKLEDVDKAIEVIKRLKPELRTKAMIKVMEAFP